MQILESLLAGLCTVCASFTDPRRSPDVDYSMADIGLSAFFPYFSCRVSPFCPTSGGWSKGTDLQLPYALRNEEDTNRQLHPSDARPGLPRGIAALFRSGHRAVAATRRPEGLSAVGGAHAGGAGWDGIFLFAKAELSAVPFTPAQQ